MSQSVPKERLNIALVILHADPARGGAERYTNDLAAALAQQHAVVILASSFGATGTNDVQRCTLHSAGSTRTRRYFNFLDSLDAHLRTSQYDIVHAMLPVRRCDLYHPHAGLATTSVERATGWKRLNNRLNPRRNAFARIERELLIGQQSPTVLCLSQQMRNDVIASGRVRSDRAVVLFNAVNLEKFDPAAFPHQPSDRPRALIIAQDFARKGLKPAIEAIAASPPWNLTVVGRDDPAPYRRLAKTLDVEDRIIFAGPMADVRPVYQLADAFLLPTRQDPCSLVVLEALAMGVPVISTRANGACEIMTDGVDGFVIDDADDVAAIKQALQNLSDPQQRAVMSNAALALRKQLSFDSHVGNLIEIAQRTRTAERRP